MLKSSRFQKYISERLEEATSQAKGLGTKCTDLQGKEKEKEKRKKRGGGKKKKKKGSPRENSSGASNQNHRKILLQKPGPRGKCCSPDESLAEGQRQREDPHGFILAESRAAGCSGKAPL